MVRKTVQPTKKTGPTNGRKRRKSGLVLETKEHASEAKLLNGILAGSKLCRTDAQDADHGHAAIADLLGPHLIGVHLQA
eukprot:CAMPEP_0204533214 /NCGR_PEP_ID=MMETSP0661-20131031/12160_1 /ASSEMBLY_ACC=CAM_ASM_000606 /TAXON_ID=109239 /ORGANISM="Alexandrium margalefi, Strain AMGDE01CS-322" /LENGTH=78 /DNA_ID=CAMNT_0051539537 /DNA_START=139 /DNA_END=372 /DNA_ORIENTATION=-